MATESTSQLGRIEGYVIDVGAGGAATRRRPRRPGARRKTTTPSPMPRSISTSPDTSRAPTRSVRF